MSVALNDFRRREPGPPINGDAEVGIIAAAMTDNAVVARLDRLEARHFDDPLLGHAWLAIQTLVADGINADALTVFDRMRGTDPATRALLIDLWEKGHGPAAEPYADIVIELYARRQIIALAAEATEAAKSGQPSAKVRGDLEAALLDLTKRDRRVQLVSAAQAADDVLADLDGEGGDAVGILTGIEALDEHLGAFGQDDLVLIAGRPGGGKSALAGCIMLNVARAGVGVIEINAEMNTRQMMRRHLTDLCFSRWGSRAPTYKDIRRKRISYDQRQMLTWARDQVAGLPLCMVKRTGLSLASLRALVRRQAAIWEAEGITLGLISVDHVGLLMGETGGRDRYTDQTSIAIGMKALADELRIPVIALVQLSRKVEDRDHKKPQLSDLRDSGAWEENADTVIGVYREAYYALKEQEPKGGRGADDRWDDWSRRKNSKVVEAILLKVREGEESVIPLWASIGHNAIRSSAPDGDLI